MNKGFWQKFLSRKTLVSLIAVFIFMGIASGFNSAWGSVRIKDVYYPNSEGTMIHAQLFVPAGVSSANPAPAILNMHGGSDYLQTVTNYSIELARRGYIVLAVDAYGSGDSDYVSGVATNAGGSGGTNTALKMDGGASTGLEQLISWDFVDQNNIGLIGHSMGGTYIANAALAYSDHVKAIMPWGSGSFVDMMKKTKTTAFPFNVGYINAKSDEMVAFATGAKPTELLNDDLLKAFVGTTSTIEAGKVYGNFDAGTARVIYNPSTSHIGNIICQDSIGSIMTFFEKAMPTGSSLASTNQVWMYKEFFCVLAIVALTIFIMNFAAALLKVPAFAGLVNTSELPVIKEKKWMRIAAFLLCIIVPILTLHKVGLEIAAKVKPNSIFPMNWANNLALLAVVNSVIFLVIFLIWKYTYGKKNGCCAAAFGLADETGKFSWKYMFKSLGLAAIVMVGTYLIVDLCYAMFHIDFRFWQFGVMPITLKRLAYLPGYLLLYVFAIGVINIISVLVADLTVKETSKFSVVKQYLLAMLIGAGGYLIVLIIYYAGLKMNQWPPFFYGYPPFVTGHPNSLVFSMKTTVLVPTFAILSVINTYLFRKTKNIYLGWFITAILAAMILIATNAFAI